jgi:hypothetical protein
MNPDLVFGSHEQVVFPAEQAVAHVPTKLGLAKDVPSNLVPELVLSRSDTKPTCSMRSGMSALGGKADRITAQEIAAEATIDSAITSLMSSFSTIKTADQGRVLDTVTERRLLIRADPQGPSSAITRRAWRGTGLRPSLYARELAGVAAPAGLSLMGVCHGGKLVRSAHCCSPHPTARGGRGSHAG